MLCAANARFGRIEFALWFFLSTIDMADSSLVTCTDNDVQLLFDALKRCRKTFGGSGRSSVAYDSFSYYLFKAVDDWTKDENF